MQGLFSSHKIEDGAIVRFILYNKLTYLLNVKDDEGIFSERTIKDLKKALKDVKEGKFISHDEVKRKLDL